MFVLSRDKDYCMHLKEESKLDLTRSDREEDNPGTQLQENKYISL